jgi:hypothetical protein
VALGTLEYLVHELDLIPWKAALNKLTFIDQMLRGREGYPEFRDYLVRQLRPIYNHLGFAAKVLC